MSGGSLNSAYYKIEYIAEDLLCIANTNRQRSMVKHLLLIAKALHDIEWVHSGDYGPGDENPAIDAVLPKKIQLETAVEQAKLVLADLQELLAQT